MNQATNDGVIIISKFDLKKSVKFDLKSEEKYVVVRDNAIVLRILGEEGNYAIITPTAGDDKGGHTLYQDTSLLMEVFSDVINEFNLSYVIKQDWKGREYASLEKADFISDACKFAEVFIDHLIRKGYSKATGRDEMQEIYDGLYVDEGEPVYMSDGMYLFPDGSMKEL